MGFFYIFVTIAMAIGCFWIRKRHRLVYGLFEIVGAFCLMIAVTFSPQALFSGPAAQFSFLSLLLSWPAEMAAAVYIFVEGLGNIDESPPQTTLRAKWAVLKQTALRRWGGAGRRS